MQILPFPSLIVVLHVWCKATLIANVACLSPTFCDFPNTSGQCFAVCAVGAVRAVCACAKIIPRRILAILFLDDTLQVVVHLCANNHRLLETRCTHREDHELLAGQAVSSVASTIDDVEGWYGHHELIGGLSGNLGLSSGGWRGWRGWEVFDAL